MIRKYGRNIFKAKVKAKIFNYSLFHKKKCKKIKKRKYLKKILS